MASAAMKKTIKAWPAVSHLISVPHTKRDYERIVALLDELIDTIGEETRHPLSSLIETLGALVENYEAAHVPELRGDTTDILTALMEEHGLSQGDLPEIGSQGVVSEILRGRRTLNLRQVRTLSERFRVSPMVFLPPTS